MKRLGPAARDRLQPVARAGETAGHRGDGVGVTAEVDRGAHRLLVASGGAQRPDGGAQTGPDGAVELGGLIRVPATVEDDGVPVPVVRVHQVQDVRERRQRVAAVECDAYEFMEDGSAFPGGAVAMGEGGDAAGGVHGGLLSVAGVADRRGGRPHHRAVAGRPQIDLEVDGRGQVPGQTVGQHVFGLQADVLGPGRGPPLKAGEDVRQVQLAPLDQGLRDQDRHLCVVRGLAPVPATAPAHLATDTARREPGGERSRRAELERGSQRVAHRRADDHTGRLFLPTHVIRVLRPKGVVFGPKSALCKTDATAYVRTQDDLMY